MDRRAHRPWPAPVRAGVPRFSGAIPAEHPAAVLQLAPVLHQVAVLAYELFVGGRDHLDRERFEPLLPTDREHRVVLFLLFRGPGLALRQKLLQARLDLALLRLGGGGGGLLLVFSVRGLLQFFVLEGLVDVLREWFFGHLSPCTLLRGRGILLP